jgi:hypothetical protein
MVKKTDTRFQKIQDGISLENATDEYSMAGLEQLESAEVKFREEQIKQLQDDREARKKYAKIIYATVIFYLSGVFLLIIFHQFLSLSDKLLIALLTSTTISIIGLLATVVKYLFCKTS